MAWDELQPTEHEQVRYCHNCSQPVFRVQDLAGFSKAAAANCCVMVKPDAGSMYLGNAGFIEYMPQSRLNWTD